MYSPVSPGESFTVPGPLRTKKPPPSFSTPYRRKAAKGFLHVRCRSARGPRGRVYVPAAGFLSQLRVVYGWYRRRAQAQGHADGRCGSVTFVQRFGSSINLKQSASVERTAVPVTAVTRRSPRLRPAPTRNPAPPSTTANAHTRAHPQTHPLRASQRPKSDLTHYR